MRIPGMRTRILALGAAGLVVAGVMVPVGTASAAAIRYEAENATIFHGVVESNHLGFSGTGFVNFTNEVGSYVEFTVNAANAGTATLSFRYANGDTTNRPMDIAVNGALASDELAFPSTVAWSTWATTSITAAVNAGTNTIRATGTTANGGPNVDFLDFEVAAPTTDYQAEDATISQGVVESNHLGFTGTGFVNYDNVVGSYVEFTVTAGAAGAASLEFRFANGDTTNRPMDIAINGTLASDELAFTPTGAWTTWATQTITANLNAGTNTIRATATTVNGGPNLDRLRVGVPGGGDTQPPTTPGNPRVTGTTSSSISLAWDASTDNVGVTGYRVERCQGAGCSNFAQVSTPTGTSFADAGLAASTSYSYRVVAVDPSGNVSTYSNVVSATTSDAPPPGLVAGYSFDDGSGTTVADSSGNGNTGTITGATWVAGRYGGGLSFIGTGNRVRVESSASLNLASGMTLAAWIRPTAAQSGWRTIMQKEVDAYLLHASNDTGALRPAGGGTLGGSVQLVRGPTASPVDAWTHVALTYDGSTLRLFVNGLQVASTPAAGAIQSTANPLWIGGNNPYGEYFQGIIDEARVYNRALAAAEILTVMNNPIAPPAPDTTPPTAPTDLTANAVAPTQINLAWTASTDNVGVTGYRVERCQGAGCTTFSQVATPTGTTFTDPGVAASTTYRYQVRAVDAAGNLGGYSGIVAATTPATPPPPPPPTGYPQANNTGYPHGLPGDTRTPVTLSAYTGPCTINTPNTVIDSKDITCQINIRAPGVLIKNSRFRLSNTGGININNVYHAVIMDTEIDGQHLDNSVGGISLIGDGSYTCIRCDLHGSGDGARANWGGVAIVDSWIHDPYCLQSSCHNDGIQSTGWTDNCDGPAEGLGPVGFSDVTAGSYCIRIVHTRIENPHTQTSNILLKADQGPVHDVLVENNLFNGGGWTFYWYDAGFQISNGLVRNNRFRRAAGGGYWPNGGYYGPVASNVPSSQSSRYPTWTNNVWDDNGAQIPF